MKRVALAGVALIAMLQAPTVSRAATVTTPEIISKTTAASFAFIGGAATAGSERTRIDFSMPAKLKRMTASPSAS